MAKNPEFYLARMKATLDARARQQEKYDQVYRNKIVTIKHSHTQCLLA